MPNKMKRFKLTPLLEERLVLTILDCLDAQERNVMEYRVGFGINDGLTYAQIGDLLGLSAQRVSDIEEDALARIVQSSRKGRMEKHRATYQTKIGELHLQPRTHNMLIGSGIIYVEQLAQYTEKDLSMVPGIGKAMLVEIGKRLRGKGIGQLTLESAKLASKKR